MKLHKGQMVRLCQAACDRLSTPGLLPTSEKFTTASEFRVEAVDVPATEEHSGGVLLSFKMQFQLIVPERDILIPTWTKPTVCENPYEAALRALLPHVIAIRQRPDNTPEFTRAVDHAVSLFGPARPAPQEPNPILQFVPTANTQPKEIQ